MGTAEWGGPKKWAGPPPLEKPLRKMNEMERNVFTYWEGSKYKLLEILREIKIKFSKSGTRFNLVSLSEKNIDQYCDFKPKNFDSLSPAHKADFYRVYLINKYGGIWLDADTLLMSDMGKLFEQLEKHRGFFMTENNRYIANGVFGSNKDTDLMNGWLEHIVRTIEVGHRIQWTDLGNAYLTALLLKNRTKFENYIVFNGLKTMYPVNWDNAAEIYLRSNHRLDYVLRDFQPLIVLVNSVYKEWESDERSSKSSLLSDLIKIAEIKADMKPAG